MKRLFFALWPDQATRQSCAKIAKTFVRSGGVVVRPDNLHVTLVFLGSVDSTTEAAITEAASALQVPSLSLVFDRLAYWRKPRIVCLAGHADGDELVTLVSQLNNLANFHGIETDARPYTPHVTLLRKAGALPETSISPIDWQADSFCLVESRSGTNGAEYRVIRKWRKAPGCL